MRCMPLAIFVRNLDDQEKRLALQADCEFTHPHPYVIEVVFIFVTALNQLFHFDDKVRDSAQRVDYVIQYVLRLLDEPRLNSDKNSCNIIK